MKRSFFFTLKVSTVAQTFKSVIYRVIQISTHLREIAFGASKFESPCEILVRSIIQCISSKFPVWLDGHTGGVLLARPTWPQPQKCFPGYAPVLSGCTEKWIECVGTSKGNSIQISTHQMLFSYGVWNLNHPVYEYVYTTRANKKWATYETFLFASYGALFKIRLSLPPIK